MSPKLRQLTPDLPGWAWIFLIALVLRLANLGGERLWFDEAWQAWASKPSTDLWAAILGDTHPPLWSIIQAINVRLFGMTEFSFRLPAALLSSGACLLIWLIARRMKFSPRTALAAGLIAAIMPGSVYFGQDARMYALLSFTVLLMLYAAIRANWYLFAIAAVGAVFTQNVGVVYTAAIGGAAILLSRDRVELAKRLMSVAFVAFAWSPWASVVVQQAANVKAAFWLAPLTPAAVLWPIAANTFGWRIPPVLMVPIYSAAFGITFVSLINARKWLITRAGLLTLACAFGAPLIIASISAVWTNIYVVRAILPSTMLLALFWAYPLNHLGKDNRRIAQAAVIPALLVSLAFNYIPARGRDDLYAWMQPIRVLWADADVLYYADRTTAISYGLYAEGRPYAVRPLKGDVIQVTDPVARAFHLRDLDFDALASAGYRRAWLILNWSPFTTGSEQIAIKSILDNYPAVRIKRTNIDDLMTDELYLVDLR